MTEGIILKEKRGLFTVGGAEGCISCRAATRLRADGTEPVAGDIALYEKNSDGTGFITGIKPRKNYFLRPHIANCDVFVIVTAPADPAPDLYVIDKLAAAAAAGGAEPLFIINKNDVGDGASLAGIYEKCGYRVFRTEADTGDGVREPVRYISGRISVFCGASGVGKSSLLNAMFPGINAETGDLSEKISRGRNTTRHTELFPTEGGGYVADTPGFSLLEIGSSLRIKPSELADLFPEFSGFRYDCRFRSCTHTKEDGCAVTAAAQRGDIPASRRDSYIRMYTELKIIDKRN